MTIRVYNEIVSQIDRKIQTFEQNEIGWIPEKCFGADIRITEFDLFKAGCFISIAEKLRMKCAIVNPLSPGNECFKWAFLAGMHYADVQGSHRERTSKYNKFIHLYDFKC
jgi:hypothetical protein